MRPAALRDVNQKYLDALRRALEQADGLEQVFESFFPLNQQGLGQNAIGENAIRRIRSRRYFLAVCAQRSCSSNVWIYSLMISLLMYAKASD